MKSIGQKSFNGGEWSPSLYARNDLAKYATAVRRMKNFFPHPHGPVSNRGGTKYIGEVRYSSRKTRLVPFEYGSQTNTVFEFGHLYYQAWNALFTGPFDKFGGTPVVTPYTEDELDELKFSFSAKSMYITHPSHAPMVITTGDLVSGLISTLIMEPQSPLPTTVARHAGTGTGSSYVVTSVTLSGEESVASAAVAGGAGDTFDWDDMSVNHYRIYKDANTQGVYGFIGYANSPIFKEPATAITPDYSVNPPIPRTPFQIEVGRSGSTANDYPAVSTLFGQRIVFAHTNQRPNTFFGSAIRGSEDYYYANMNRRPQVISSDAYEFSISSNGFSGISWLVSAQQLLIFSRSEEWKATGSQGAITPMDIDLKKQSAYGSQDLVAPIIVDSSILFVDKSGQKVRDLSYSYEVEGYKGSDLSILASHLFKDHYIKSWCYQSAPDSIIWAIRDDGILIGLTYHKEHEVFAWHQHETDGEFESIVSIAEGIYSDVYVIVKRVINGETKRYIEKFMPRLPIGVDYEYYPEDSYFVDCGLSFDGNNDVDGMSTSGCLLSVSGGTYLANSDVILSASGHSPFTQASEGKRYRLRFGDDVVDVEVDDYTSTSGVVAHPVSSSVPASLRQVHTSDWALIASKFTGLSHLEGKDVSILSDGFVITDCTVSGGEVETNFHAAKSHVGLGYTSELETLDFDFDQEDGSIQDKLKNIPSVVARLENTRAMFIGPNADALTEVVFRTEELYNEPTELFTGDKEILLDNGIDREGKIYIRQTEPLPITVTALLLRMEAGEQ